MTIHNLTKLLDAHGINYDIIDNKVIADNSYTIDGILHADTIDLTDFSKEQLLTWLGY